MLNKLRPQLPHLRVLVIAEVFSELKCLVE